MKLLEESLEFSKTIADMSQGDVAVTTDGKLVFRGPLSAFWLVNGAAVSTHLYNITQVKIYAKGTRLSLEV